ncbi:MAG: peroxiredoxin [Actinomycetota bacterium]
MAVDIGDLAPDFELINQHGETVKLSSFRGVKPVVLVFYPLSFSGTCTGELCELRDNIAVFESAQTELLAISVDSKFTQKRFAETEGYKFNVLADFWPHGAVAKEYGVFIEESGIAKRATFLIDADGKIRAKFVNGPGEARDFGSYVEALAAL